MATGGWGKRAATRIDRTQFEHDELLKSLGSQFNVDFTGYEQWQRQTKVTKPVKLAASADVSGFLVGRVKSSESKKLVTNRDKNKAALLEELEREQLERIKILKMRLKLRKNELQISLLRYETLLTENIKLKESIEGDEKGTHDFVKKLLRRYEQYRGGITTLNINFAKELAEANEDFENTKKRLQDKIAVLEKRVAGVNTKLEAQQEMLRVLLSYKDKEYPVKAMKITNLHEEIDSLQLSNKEDQEELEHIISTEIGKHEKKRIQTTNNITRNVTENAVALMHPSLKEMALQNMVMAKEIQFHLKEQEEVEIVNQVLEDGVRELLHDPKTNIRLQMFPEFFPMREKCTPDMDVILDIPTKEWLPI